MRGVVIGYRNIEIGIGVKPHGNIVGTNKISQIELFFVLRWKFVIWADFLLDLVRARKVDFGRASSANGTIAISFTGWIFLLWKWKF